MLEAEFPNGKKELETSLFQVGHFYVSYASVYSVGLCKFHLFKWMNTNGFLARLLS